MPVSFKQRKAQQIVKEARKTLARKHVSVNSRVARSLPAAAVQQAVRRAMSRDTEQKFVNTLLDYGPFLSSTGTNNGMICVNATQQGTGQFNRVGNKIKLKSLRVRVHLRNTWSPQSASANAQPDNVVRCLVLWCQDGGAVPVWASIFNEADQAGAIGSSTLSLIDPAQNGRYRILRDKSFVMKPSTAPNYLLTTTARPGTDIYTDGTAYGSEFWDEFIDLSADTFKTTYNGTADPATEDQIINGALLVCFRATQNTAICSVSSIDTSFARLRYEDM